MIDTLLHKIFATVLFFFTLVWSELTTWTWNLKYDVDNRFILHYPLTTLCIYQAFVIGTKGNVKKP